MTLTVAFSNFEFFFFFHFQKGFMLVYSREKLKCGFSFFFAVSRILLTDRKLALCFVTFVKTIRVLRKLCTFSSCTAVIYFERSCMLKNRLFFYENL